MFISGLRACMIDLAAIDNLDAVGFQQFLQPRLRDQRELRELRHERTTLTNVP